jgi:alpha-methylacyl-CoA racemase
VFEGSDACVAPVLSLHEAPEHPHLAERKTFVEHHGVVQPAPAPRFSGTPTALRLPPAFPGAHSRDVLMDWGIDRPEDILASGVARQADRA